MEGENVCQEERIARAKGGMNAGKNRDCDCPVAGIGLGNR